MEIVFIIGGFIIAPYAEHNFILKALRKLYLAKTKDKSLFYKPNKLASKVMSEDPSSNKNALPIKQVDRRGKTNNIIKISLFQKYKILLTKATCCCLSDHQKRKNKLWRMYQNGQDRIDKEFDIVNIV